MPQTTRRGFLVGCSAAIAAMSGSRFNTLAFGNPGDENCEILVSLYLRGGADGLNMVMPTAGVDRGHYEAARPDLAVPNSGPNAALPLGGGFGLHPSMAPIHDLYQSNKLSIIHATGLTSSPSRSHFDAQQYMELGTPGVTSSSSGWLTRHLHSAQNLPTEIVMPSVALGNLQQTSLRGNFETVNMSDPGSFNLNTGPSTWRSAQRKSLRRLYREGNSWLHQTGLQGLDALDIIELNVDGGYTPANGANYPSGSFGTHLKAIAQLAKLDLGLRVATLDLGGWDTHNGQGDGSGGYFSGLVEDLAEGLKALYVDLDGSGANNHTSRLTVVVMSEFGRRLAENADNGSDHGFGNAMWVMSGNATGGLHGQWPGLHNDQLFDGADLAVTTDYRQVLSEILIRRMGNNQLGTIFPGLQTYEPLGVVQGPDSPPIFGEEIFSDGFESGNSDNWSAAVG